jgi:hypothetical protein
MTAFDETDRRIAAWFTDEPVRAPDRTIDAALAHARAHPRLPDPLASIRRDPMAGRSGLGALFAPAPLLAVIGLLIVAVLGAAVAGGFLQQAPPVVPLPPSPQPTTTASPAASPTPRVFHVDLAELYGADASIDIVDRSGAVAAAFTGQPAEGGSVGEGLIEITADPDDPTTAVLRWTGTPGDTTHGLDIGPDARALTITRPRCSGDAFPRDLVLQLDFSTALDVARMTGRVVTQ